NSLLHPADQASRGRVRVMSGPGNAFGRDQVKGAEANRLSPSASERYLVMCCPRTLLPAASSGGENVPRPPLPGDTVTMPPATPLLPGRPTSYSHSPDCSYSPAVASTASTRLQ